MHHRRFIDPNRETNRKPQIIIAKRSGRIVHVDVKRSRSSRRWCLACPRAWPRPGQTIVAPKNEEQAVPYRLHLSPFRDRWNTRLAYTKARHSETAATTMDFMNNVHSSSPPTASPVSGVRQWIMLPGISFHISPREATRYRIRLTHSPRGRLRTESDTENVRWAPEVHLGQQLSSTV